MRKSLKLANTETEIMLKKYLSQINRNRRVATIIGVIIIALVVLAGYFIASNGENGEKGLLRVEAGNFVNSVSISGKVTAAQKVDLSFNQSGKVARVAVNVSGQVAQGQVIAEIDSVNAALELENARLVLKKIEQPSDQSDILQAESELSSAEAAFTAAENTLQKVYEDGFNESIELYQETPVIIEGLDDLIINKNGYLNESAIYNLKVNTRTVRARAQSSYYKLKNSYSTGQALYGATSRNSLKDDLEKLIERRAIRS